MEFDLTTARATLAAVLAVAGILTASAPASALPASPLAATATDASQAAPAVEQVRLYRGGFRRGYGFHRGFGYRGYGYRGYGYRRGFRGGLPGHPIRRILRHL